MDQVTVSIQDTGLGVPLAEQAAIFDEFRQSERTVSRGYGGLGIGLAICRQLIEMHDGRLGVHSSGSENGGSTFYFTLPVLEAPPLLPQAAPSQSVLVLTSLASRAIRLREHLVTEGFQVEILGIDEITRLAHQRAGRAARGGGIGYPGRGTGLGVDGTA